MKQCPLFLLCGSFSLKEWKYEQVYVPGTSKGINWGSAIALDPREGHKEEGWAYVVGTQGYGFMSTQTLGRVPVKDLMRLDFSTMEGRCH